MAERDGTHIDSRPAGPEQKTLRRRLADPEPEFGRPVDIVNARTVGRPAEIPSPDANRRSIDASAQALARHLLVAPLPLLLLLVEAAVFSGGVTLPP